MHQVGDLTINSILHGWITGLKFTKDHDKLTLRFNECVVTVPVLCIYFSWEATPGNSERLGIKKLVFIGYL